MRSRRKKAPSVPASLQRSASASNRRFSLPENWRRLAIATTSGSRRAAASDGASLHALRALLAPGKLAAIGDRNDLRVTARRRLRGRLSSRPTGSFRDGLGGATQRSIYRRLQQWGHVDVLPGG